MVRRQTNKPRARSAILLSGLALAGALLVPLAVYLFGSTLMGPYEGDGGLVGFLATVYADLLRGRPGALALVLSPTVFFALWWLIFRLVRRRRAEATEHTA